MKIIKKGGKGKKLYDTKMKMSIQEVSLLEEISDDQLAIAEVYICCEGKTENEVSFDKKSIEQAIPTLYNKFLVAGYRNYDFEGHEEDQQILGFFPENNNVRFEEKDGKLFLVANAIISKVYAEWAYNIFLEDDNHKEVSMEIVVIDKEDRNGETFITSFAFLGVTVLGSAHTAACPGSDIKIIKFSTEKMIAEGNKIYKKYCEIFSEDEWDIPHKVKENAKEGIDLKIKHKYGGSSMLLAFARYLCNNDKITKSRLDHYSKYLPKNNVDCTFSEPPTKEYISYMLCGGKEGKEWIFNIREEINKEMIKRYFEDENLTVDKSKESLSFTPWGSIDKAQLKKDVIKAKNFKTIAKDVFMRLEDGWEEGKEGALKYPVMQKKGEKLVYNRYGLSTALAMARQQNETDVISKVEKIMKSLDIEEEKEAKEKKEMSVNKFEIYEHTYSEIRDMANVKLKDYEKNMYVADVADDFLIVYDVESGIHYVVEYDIDHDDIAMYWDEKKVVRQVWKEVYSLDEYADVGACLELLDIETKQHRELANDLHNIKAPFEKEKKSTVYMDDEKYIELENENKELKESIKKLQEFKEMIEEEKKNSIVMDTISEVCASGHTIPHETIDMWKEEACKYTLSDIEMWKNYVYAKAFVITNKADKKDTFSKKMGLPFFEEKKEQKDSLWD